MDLRLRLDSKPVIYGFTGRQFDPESSTYYYRARTYSPELGRFLTKDPIGFAGGDANLYRYVGNDPPNAVDPLGLDVWFLQGGALYGVAESPGSSSGATGSFGVGIGFDTETGNIFFYTTSGSGTEVGGAFAGGGISAGVFGGSQEQFLGEGVAKNVSAGFVGGAGLTHLESGGETGTALDLLGIAFGATTNTQKTSTNQVGGNLCALPKGPR